MTVCKQHRARSASDYCELNNPAHPDTPNVEHIDLEWIAGKLTCMGCGKVFKNKGYRAEAPSLSSGEQL